MELPCQPLKLTPFALLPPRLHTFDMRKLGFPLQVHKDHISAVISLDYSPTGREFVSAGYDKTIRIFNSRERRSHEVYHTKRMQRLTDIVWSMDSRYIISSSDEMDIRIWKAQASEKLGFVSVWRVHKHTKILTAIDATVHLSTSIGAHFAI